MSSLGEAVRLTGRATLALDREVNAKEGPDPGRLRAVGEQLYDAAAMLMQSAGDIEMGID